MYYYLLTGLMDEDRRVDVGEELAELLPLTISNLRKELQEKEEIELRLLILTGKVVMWNPGIAISTTVSTTSDRSYEESDNSEDEDEDEDEGEWLLQNDGCTSTEDSADVGAWLDSNDVPTHTFAVGEKLFGNLDSLWSPCTVLSTQSTRTYIVIRQSDEKSFTVSEDLLRVSPPHNQIERSSIRPVGVTTRSYEVPNFETFENPNL